MNVAVGGDRIVDVHAEIARTIEDEADARLLQLLGSGQGLCGGDAVSRPALFLAGDCAARVLFPFCLFSIINKLIRAPDRLVTQFFRNLADVGKDWLWLIRCRAVHRTPAFCFVFRTTLVPSIPPPPPPLCTFADAPRLP